MKRKRIGNSVIAAIIIGLVVLVGIATSVYDNYQVRSRFTDLFEAVRMQDVSRLREIYHGRISDNYVDQLLEYQLVGWEITEIEGQPWPTADLRRYQKMRADVYYSVPEQSEDLPEDVKEITHPQFGPCIKVPVVLRFDVDPDAGFLLQTPDRHDGSNWLIPFTPKDGAEETQ